MEVYKDDEEHLSYEEKLGLFSLEKAEGIFSIFLNIQRADVKTIGMHSLSSVVPSGRARDKGHKLEYRGAI